MVSRMEPPIVLPREFFERSPDQVARDLLGKTLVRNRDGRKLGGTIVETEAYMGTADPASRAFRGLKNYNRVMWGEPGRLFVYNVHKYWMLNVVSHTSDRVGGVLFRAIEPTRGVDEMRRNRGIDEITELARGPGKLTVALGVTSELNGYPVTDPDSPVAVFDAPCVVDYCTSKRIGVTRDLPEELRFYVRGSAFVSRG
jgi:DNA-3-methyladenine glycosylase